METGSDSGLVEIVNHYPYFYHWNIYSVIYLSRGWLGSFMMMMMMMILTRDIFSTGCVLPDASLPRDHQPTGHDQHRYGAQTHRILFFSRLHGPPPLTRLLLLSGTIGHVAHGKSTVVKAISGVHTVRFKNELERNITIKLGYANAKVGSQSSSFWTSSDVLLLQHVRAASEPSVCVCVCPAGV